MKHLFFLSVLVQVALIILLESCKREDFRWGKDVGKLTYVEDVVLLGPDEKMLLTEVTDNKIVFRNSTPEIGKISNKSIIVSGVTALAPYGLIRKVNGINVNGSEVTVNCTNAVLQDVIKEGSINIRTKLLVKDFTLKSKVDAVVVNGPDNTFDGLSVTLNNLEIFREGTKVITINGIIGVSPEIDLLIKIEAGVVSEINLFLTLSKTDDLVVTSNEAFSGTREMILAEFTHSPIVTDSLVFVPEVKIVCGIDGTTSSGITMGVKQDRVITSKVNYKNSNWTEDPLAYSIDYDFTKPLISDNADFKLYSGPEAILKLFGIAVHTARAIGYSSIKAQKTASPFWQLFIGNDGQSTFKPDFLGLNGDHNSSLKIPSVEIANSNGRK